MADEWIIREGEITTRGAIKDVYGGTIYGGIEPSRTTPNIMIYTDPVQGAVNGYDYDGFDDNDPNVFYYTGEGPNGDQELRVGNRAIYEHAESKRTLRLFEVASGKQPGGKLQRYLGAFRLDDARPFRMEPAPGKDGVARKVIVFRLIKEGTAPLDVEPSPPVPAEVKADLESSPSPRSAGAISYPSAPSSTGEPDLDPGVHLVPLEAHNSLEYDTAPPKVGGIASKDEAKLVTAFEGHLSALGHGLRRARITIAGVKHPLITDTYDLTEGRLYEAKSSSDRATIRLAIGQLMDYLRFMPDVAGGVLVQSEPSVDLKELIWSAGFTVTYRRGGEWVTE